MPIDLNILFSGLGGALVGGAASFFGALMAFSTGRQQVQQLKEQVSQLKEQGALQKTQIEQSNREFEAFRHDRDKLSKSRLIDLDDLLEEICEDLIEFSGISELSDQDVEVLGTRKSLQEAGAVRSFLSEVKLECEPATYDSVKSFMRSCIDLVDGCKSYIASSKPDAERAEILESVASALKIGESARQKLAPRVS